MSTSSTRASTADSSKLDLSPSADKGNIPSHRLLKKTRLSSDTSSQLDDDDDYDDYLSSDLESFDEDEKTRRREDEKTRRREDEKTRRREDEKTKTKTKITMRQTR